MASSVGKSLLEHAVEAAQSVHELTAGLAHAGADPKAVQQLNQVYHILSQVVKALGNGPGLDNAENPQSGQQQAAPADQGQDQGQEQQAAPADQGQAAPAPSGQSQAGSTANKSAAHHSMKAAAANLQAAMAASKNNNS